MRKVRAKPDRNRDHRHDQEAGEKESCQHAGLSPHARQIYPTSLKAKAQAGQGNGDQRQTSNQLKHHFAHFTPPASLV